MPNPDNESLLSSLEKSAKRLNRASDSINGVITAIQERLVASNFGLEFWFQESPLAVDHGSAFEVKVILGFAWLEGGWCLATRHDTDTVTFYAHDRQMAPLLSASREIRLMALRSMPNFLAALQDHIDTTANLIESSIQSVTVK